MISSAHISHGQGCRPAIGSYRDHLNEYYGQEDLCGQIRWECEKLGLIPGGITREALDWFDGLAAGISNSVPRSPGLNLGVVLGPDAAEKSRNLQRNLREGLIQVVRGYFIT